MTASHILGSVVVSVVVCVGVGVVGDDVVDARTGGGALSESTGGTAAHHVSGEDSRGLWGSSRDLGALSPISGTLRAQMSVCGTLVS